MRRIVAALNSDFRYHNEYDSTGGGSGLCRVEAYVQIVSWTSTVYVFMWMCVDRHKALEKPTRYEVTMVVIVVVTSRRWSSRRRAASAGSASRG